MNEFGSFVCQDARNAKNVKLEMGATVLYLKTCKSYYDQMPSKNSLMFLLQKKLFQKHSRSSSHLVLAFNLFINPLDGPNLQNQCEY